MLPFLLLLFFFARHKIFTSNWKVERGKNLKQKTCTFSLDWPVCDLGHTHIAKHNFNEIIRSFFSFLIWTPSWRPCHGGDEKKKQSYGKVRLQVWKLKYFGELGGCAKGFGVRGCEKRRFPTSGKKKKKKWIDWQKFCRMILSHHRFQFFPLSLSLLAILQNWRGFWLNSWCDEHTSYDK